jgi:hypothetical protein
MKTNYLKPVSKMLLNNTEKTGEEALKDLKMYFGEPPIKEEMVRKRLSSGLLEMQLLEKYLITVDDLMSKAGFEVIK